MSDPTAVSAPSQSSAAGSPSGAPTSADLDRMLHVWQSRFTGGRSPSTVGLAWLDWAVHAANAPFQSASLGRDAMAQWLRLSKLALADEPVIQPDAGDRRFSHSGWSHRPYSLLAQAALLGEEWWDLAVRTPPGVSRYNRRIVEAGLRRVLDQASPSNLPWLNPEVIEATRASGGANLAAGLDNFLRERTGSPREEADARPAYELGRDVAATPGKVVFRNAMFELIQYSPATDAVWAEPVLMVPAWIMKYYILDLTPKDSMVRWLVERGHTVFAISWRNPDAGMREATLEDYRVQGVMAAIEAVSAIGGGARIHAVGYCLGGTLLTMAAAAMARDGDDRLASLSLFAAQTDFTEAGELLQFITEDQLDFLDDIMKTQGYLDSAQMAGAFQMLRPRDMIWTKAIHEYLLGERERSNPLLAWNADGTRMPARMHIEYLRGMFLHNDLAEGRFRVEGRPLSLGDIRAPIFLVGTEADHIAPWRSVYKLHGLNGGALTFVLASGGHNAGIVSEPGHPHRHYRIGTRAVGAPTPGRGEWEAAATRVEGSWWPAWGDWLAARSGDRVAPPPMGGADYPPLADAPGDYVRQA
ncbi:MAG: PHA/PHB synthase family protein [Caulobacter sp.]